MQAHRTCTHITTHSQGARNPCVLGPWHSRVDTQARETLPSMFFSTPCLFTWTSGRASPSWRGRNAPSLAPALSFCAFDSNAFASKADLKFSQKLSPATRSLC